MPYQLLYDLMPEIAEAETRTVSVFGEESGTGLPPGQYSFCEMFCNERGCDCRRVFFYVVTSFRQGPQAVVAWGWETLDFYAKWLHDDDPDIIADLIGPSLNLGSPETDLSDGILNLTRDILLKDELYIERIKRHYRLFRAKIDGKPKSKGRKKKRKRKT